LIKVRIILGDFEKIKTIIKYKNIKELKGYSTYYRIRISDYRIGIRLENWIIIMERILHRKDIYKKFPM